MNTPITQSELDTIKKCLVIKYGSERCTYCREFHKGTECLSQSHVSRLLEEVERLQSSMVKHFDIGACGHAHVVEGNKAKCMWCEITRLRLTLTNAKAIMREVVEESLHHKEDYIEQLRSLLSKAEKALKPFASFLTDGLAFYENQIRERIYAKDFEQAKQVLTEITKVLNLESE